MKTKNNFANLKSSVAIVIAVFMLTFSISATETSKDCKPGKTLNSSKEFVECENGNAITALADIFEQIESTVKFKGPSVQDEDEINMALANNSPETFSGMNNDQLANKVNSTEEFVECESTSAYKALADIIGQIESSIKFKGPSVQDEEESNLTLARNSPETCLEMKDDQLANKLNSSEEFVECENTSAYKALDDIIGQIENSIKFKGPSVQDEEAVNLTLTKNSSDTSSAKKDCQSVNKSNPSKEYIECENGNAFKALANIIEMIESTIKFKAPSIQEQEESLVLTKNSSAKFVAKFASFERKSPISSELNKANSNNEIKNYRELTTWLQKKLKFELTKNFETKNGWLVIYIETDKNGTLDNCSILKASDPEVDKIVIKLISQAPLKMTLSENGFAVKQRFEIPIRYDIKL